jgi:DNA-binding transcriptional MerR regulator
MNTTTYTLEELAEQTGIEARTIRSYIEKGLLPSAQSRGRGATYLPDHLVRLRVVKMLRRAWPNLSLADIRIRLQQLTPENIQALSEGRIAAAPTTLAGEASEEPQLAGDDDFDDEVEDDAALSKPTPSPSRQLAGAERLVHALRQVTGRIAAAPVAKVEAWQRITITDDIELSVRAGFSEAQLVAFRQLADLLRDALTRAHAVLNVSTSNEHHTEADA